RVFDVGGGQGFEHLGNLFVAAAMKRIPELRVGVLRLLRHARAGSRRLVGGQPHGDERALTDSCECNGECDTNQHTSDNNGAAAHGLALIFTQAVTNPSTSTTTAQASSIGLIR